MHLKFLMNCDCYNYEDYRFGTIMTYAGNILFSDDDFGSGVGARSRNLLSPRSLSLQPTLLLQLPLMLHRLHHPALLQFLRHPGLFDRWVRPHHLRPPQLLQRTILSQTIFQVAGREGCFE